MSFKKTTARKHSFRIRTPTHTHTYIYIYMKIPRGGIGNILVLKLQQHNKNWPSSLSPFWMAKLQFNPMIRWLFLGGICKDSGHCGYRTQWSSGLRCGGRASVKRWWRIYPKHIDILTKQKKLWRQGRCESALFLIKTWSWHKSMWCWYHCCKPCGFNHLPFILESFQHVRNFPGTAHMCYYTSHFLRILDILDTHWNKCNRFYCKPISICYG